MWHDAAPRLITAGRYRMGSDPQCEIVLCQPGIAAQHALLLCGSQKVILRSWDPRTWVDDHPLVEGPLREGCRLTLGPVTFRFRRAQPDEILQRLPITVVSEREAIEVQTTPATSDGSIDSNPIARTPRGSEIPSMPPKPHQAPPTSPSPPEVSPEALRNRRANNHHTTISAPLLVDPPPSPSIIHPPEHGIPQPFGKTHSAPVTSERLPDSPGSRQRESLSVSGHSSSPETAQAVIATLLKTIQQERMQLAHQQAQLNQQRERWLAEQRSREEELGAQQRAVHQQQIQIEQLRQQFGEEQLRWNEWLETQRAQIAAERQTAEQARQFWEARHAELQEQFTLRFAELEQQRLALENMRASLHQEQWQLSQQREAWLAEKATWTESQHQFREQQQNFWNEVQERRQELERLRQLVEQQRHDLEQQHQHLLQSQQHLHQQTLELQEQQALLTQERQTWQQLRAAQQQEWLVNQQQLAADQARLTQHQQYLSELITSLEHEAAALHADREQYQLLLAQLGQEREALRAAQAAQETYRQEMTQHFERWEHELQTQTEYLQRRQMELEEELKRLIYEREQLAKPVSSTSPPVEANFCEHLASAPTPYEPLPVNLEHTHLSYQQSLETNETTVLPSASEHALASGPSAESTHTMKETTGVPLPPSDLWPPYDNTRSSPSDYHDAEAPRWSISHLKAEDAAREESFPIPQASIESSERLPKTEEPTADKTTAEFEATTSLAGLSVVDLENHRSPQSHADRAVAESESAILDDQEVLRVRRELARLFNLPRDYVAQLGTQAEPSETEMPESSPQQDHDATSASSVGVISDMPTEPHQPYLEEDRMPDTTSEPRSQVTHDDDSIDAHIARLLERVRQNRHSSDRELEEKTTQAPTHGDTRPGETTEEQGTAPQELSETPPLSQRGQQQRRPIDREHVRSHLETIRQVAHWSTQMTRERYVARIVRREIIPYTALGVFSLVAAIFYLVVPLWQGNIHLTAGAGCLVVTIFSLRQIARAAARLRTWEKTQARMDLMKLPACVRENGAGVATSRVLSSESASAELSGSTSAESCADSPVE
ncbi:MAG: hypothetical protein KatS3mg113_0971 [Planctomycetaceae bacterium]|nr:MAG: hypothetical protein KatS3mg113_0971 [Planctomycetaceae bacterium]